MPPFAFDLSQDLRLPLPEPLPPDLPPPPEPPPSKTNCIKANYIQVLHDVAEDPSVDTVCFSSFDGGLHLVVKDKGAVENLLKTKWSNFVRNLNYYNFRKFRKNEMDKDLRAEFASFPDFHAFTNEFFVQGRPELLACIKTQATLPKEETQVALAASGAPLDVLAAQPEVKALIDAERLRCEELERKLKAQEALIVQLQTEITRKRDREGGGGGRSVRNRRGRDSPQMSQRPELWCMSMPLSPVQLDGMSDDSSSDGDLSTDGNYLQVFDDGSALHAAPPARVMSCVTSSFSITPEDGLDLFVGLGSVVCDFPFTTSSQ